MDDFKKQLEEREKLADNYIEMLENIADGFFQIGKNNFARKIYNLIDEYKTFNIFFPDFDETKIKKDS